MARRTERPLVLVINNIHFFNNDENGRNVLLQLQQKAESWAASGKQFISKLIPESAHSMIRQAY